MEMSKAGKKIIAGLTEAVEYARNGMPREARRREGGSGPSGLASPVGVADAPELLRRISTLTAEVEELRAAAQPFADSVIIDQTKQRGDRHWATFGPPTNLDHVLALKAALKGEGDKT